MTDKPIMRGQENHGYFMALVVEICLFIPA